MAELSEIQKLVSETRHRRGFTTDPVQIFTLLTEEVGEVAAELKKTWSKNYADLVVDDLANELADVFVLTSALASRYDIDLETAVRNKFIAADATRTWATAVDDG